MSAPNMLSLTTITASNANVSLTTTGATSLVSNAAASGQVFKINAVYVSNTDGTTAYPITINYYSAAALAGTAFPICSTVNVPANATLLVVNKDSNLYMTENTSLGGTAGTGSKLVVTVSYEVCS